MKEVFEYIISLLKSRIFPMILVFIVLISVLVHRLFCSSDNKWRFICRRLIKFYTEDMSICGCKRSYI